METLGNTSLLHRKKIGFFASGTIAALSVLPTLDWATEVGSVSLSVSEASSLKPVDLR